MAMGWIKTRCLHIRSIGKPWWLLVEGAWGAFWTADAMIAKYGSKYVKDVWDTYTLHVFFDWKTGVIGLLAITLLLVIEGSFRYARRLKPPDLVMAEEDPKVYLEALNNSVATPNVVLQVANIGQRVNPAHTITVQPIASLPSVSFDVVDYLDMAAHAPLVPHINDAPMPFGSFDILAALRKAWEAVSFENGRADRAFEFEIRLHYEDVNRIKKFETEVKLLYFPLRDMNRSANRMFGSDHDIVKVIENRPRRIA